MYRGWPRITEQPRIADKQHLYLQAVKTHVFPGSLAFQPVHADCCTSNERRDIGGYLKACWCTPMANDYAREE